MKTLISSALFFFLAIMIAVPTLAGTRDDCVTMCKNAGAFVQARGIDKAVKEIGDKNGSFVWNDGVSYVFLMDMNLKMLAHPIKPELTKAETLRDAKDIDGKAFFVDFLGAAQKGQGWTNYSWPVPGMDVNKPKYTFIYRVPGTEYFVGAGFYVMEPGVFY